MKLKQGSANHEAAHWHFQTVWSLKRSPSLSQTSRVYLDDRFCANSRRIFLQVVLPKRRTATVNVCAGKWTHISGKGRLNSMRFHFAQQYTAQPVLLLNRFSQCRKTCCISKTNTKHSQSVWSVIMKEYICPTIKDNLS